MATTPASPKPAPHHEYESWTTSWYDARGKRRMKRFGRCDRVTKKQAQAAYSAWMRREFVTGKADIEWTVARLAEKYWDECKRIYRKNDEPTTTLDNVKLGLEQLIEMHGDLDADHFDSPTLTVFANKICQSANRDGTPRVLSLSTVNSRVQTIRRMYKWARANGWVSRDAALDIIATPLLRKGRCDAKPGRRVQPVSGEVLSATLAVAPKTIADMIRVQVLTGMRPGEICDMRIVDLDRTGEVWIYTPTTHKTQHHGKDRLIAVGPRAQAILTQYIERRKNVSDFVFLPAESHRERLELSGKPEWAAYQLSRSTFKPGRKFSNSSYRNRIIQACDHAFDSDMEKRKARDFSHRWHPHQLRHNAATIARSEYQKHLLM